MDQTTPGTYIFLEQNVRIFVFEDFAIFPTRYIQENLLKRELWEPETITEKN